MKEGSSTDAVTDEESRNRKRIREGSVSEGEEMKIAGEEEKGKKDEGETEKENEGSEGVKRDNTEGGSTDGGSATVSH